MAAAQASRDERVLGPPILTLRRRSAAQLPVVLDMSGVRWGIVGGGRVAERKIATLLRAGADVEVVAPCVTGRIGRMARRCRVRWRRVAYRPDLLKRAPFVVAATSDPGTNRRVALDARRRGAFVSVADDPALCTLMMPAVLRRGDLLVAVSTGGRCPALARQLRDTLARKLGPEYASLVRIAGSIRGRLRRVVRDPRTRARRSSRVMEGPVLRLLRSGRKRAAWLAARRAAGLPRQREAPDGGAF